MWRGLALLVGTALASCGPCDLPPADVDPGPEFPDVDAQALCVALYRGYSRQQAVSGVELAACSTPSSEPIDLAELDSEETTARLAATCIAGDYAFDAVDLAVRGRRVLFNLAAMEACAAAGRAVIDGAPISHENGEARLAEINNAFAASSCPEAATGLVEQGGACEQPWDCADPTLVCEPEAPTGAVRTCRPPAAEGDACRGSMIPEMLPIRSCGAGLYCPNGTCAPRLGEGEGGCYWDAACEEGLVCAGAACHRPRDEGGLCAPGEDGWCAEGLWCRPDHTCGPPRALGERCDREWEPCADCAVCLSLDGEIRCRLRPQAGERCDGPDDCAEGLGCDRSPGAGVCVGAVSEGGDCSSWPYTCAAGLDCIDDVCVARAALGDHCEPEFCADGLHCVGSSCHAGIPGDPCRDTTDCDYDVGLVCGVDEVCGLPVATGEPCDWDHQCSFEHYCADHTCRSFPAEGERCFGACASSAYCDADRTCVAKRQAGGPCSTDAECASGFCTTDGTCGVTPVTCLAAPGIFETMLFFAIVGPLRARQLRRWRER